MTSTHPHLRRRRLIGSALAAAVLFAGAMSACSPSPWQPQQVESTALSASQVKERISKTPTSTDDDALPVGEDYLYVSAPELTEKEKAQRGRQDRSGPNSSIVARYRGSDGSVLWAREITPAVVNWFYDDDGSSAQDVAHDLLDWRPAGYAVVSPDGRYVSLVLRPPQTRPVLHDSDDDRNPLDVVRALALGACAVGASGHVLRTLVKEGPEALRRELRTWSDHVRTLMTLLGAADVSQLRRTDVLVTGSTAERARLLGVDLTGLAHRSDS